MNFAMIRRMPKSSIKITCMEPYAIPTSFLNCNLAIFHHVKLHTFSIISGFLLIDGLPEWSSLPKNIREWWVMLPLLNSCCSHSIITKSVCNLFDGFCWCVAAFLAKFGANSLLNPLSHGGMKLKHDEHSVHTNKHMLPNSN